jgi:hypothetical protein
MDLQLIETKQAEFVQDFEQINNTITKVNSTLPSWFKLKTVFPRTGKQGIIGLATIEVSKDKKVKCVFKISQYINFLIDQEYTIMNSLNKLSHFCHNFCKSYGKISVPVDINFRKDNPFEYISKYPIQNDMMLMEYIEDSRKFYRYIKNKKVDNYILFSIIKQTMSAISIAQRHNRFTHYDLHSNNIMVKECNPNTMFLYILDEHTQLLLPTYGFYPVIIDFGFGYVGDMDGGPLYGALAHTDVGFMTNTFDKLGDPKLFLTSISWELNKYRKNDKGKEFRTLVKSMLSPLTIDWNSGWDDEADMPASDYIFYSLENNFKRSSFFKKNGDQCVDIIQCLIDLPLKKRSYKNIKEPFDVLIDEFSNIENEIGSHFYLLYIFKKIVETAKNVKTMYFKDETREESVRIFKREIYSVLSSISKYCNPKINAEKLLCSIILAAKNCEGMLYDICYERMRDKNEEYEKMEYQTVEDMLKVIDYNFSDDYDLSSDSDIIIIDSLKQERSHIILTEEKITELNNIDSSERGKYIYQNYL